MDSRRENGNIAQVFDQLATPQLITAKIRTMLSS